MNYLDTLEMIKKYIPSCVEEEKDKEEFIWLLENYQEKAFLRTNNFGHITSSSIVVDKKRKYMLMCFHNIYKSWAWLGGHADGNCNLQDVARREAKEETGIDDLKLLKDDFSSIEILAVDPHFKNGKYVSSHLHYNVTFLYEGDMTKAIKIKEDENSLVKWIKIDDIYELVKDDHNMYNIYMKSINLSKNIITK